MILNAEAIAHLQVILDGAKPSGSKQSELITKLGAIMSECYKLKEYGYSSIFFTVYSFSTLK